MVFFIRIFEKILQLKGKKTFMKEPSNLGFEVN